MTVNKDDLKKRMIEIEAELAKDGITIKPGDTFLQIYSAHTFKDYGFGNIPCMICEHGIISTILTGGLYADLFVSWYGKSEHCSKVIDVVEAAEGHNVTKLKEIVAESGIEPPKSYACV